MRGWLSLIIVGVIGCGEVAGRDVGTNDAKPADGADALDAAGVVNADGGDGGEVTSPWADSLGRLLSIRALAVDSRGDVVVVGPVNLQPGAQCANTITFPDTATTYVAKYRGSDGSRAWIWCWTLEQLTAVAIGPNDEIVVAGTGDNYAIGIVATLASDSSPLTSTPIGIGSGSIIPSSVALDAFGNVYVAGRTTGANDLGGDPYKTGVSGFVLALDPSGTARWGRHFGDDPNMFVSGLAVTKDGSLRISGTSIDSSFALGDGVSVPASSGAGFYLAAMTVDGTFSWAKSFGGTKESMGALHALVAVGDGLVISGEVDGSLALGPTTLRCPTCSPAAQFGFVAALDRDANARWAAVTTTNTTGGRAFGLASDRGANVYVASTEYDQAIEPNFGHDQITGYDVATGEVSFSRVSPSAGAENDDRKPLVAADTNAGVFMAGLYRDVMQFGATQLHGFPPDEASTYLAKIARPR